MTEAALENLIQHLEVRLESIAVGEAACERSLDSKGDAFLFVQAGTGFLQSENVRLPIGGGSMIVVPAGRSFLVDTTSTVVPIGGPGGAGASPDAAAGGPLIVVCGYMSASVGHGLGLFDHLREPLVEELHDETSALIFKAICIEAASAGLGSTALISSMLKQVMVLLLRKQMGRDGPGSPLLMPLLHPQLRAAVEAIMAEPRHHHTLGSLAALAGMSRSRFAHHFMTAYGDSPMSFLQSVRLRTAARLLQSSNMPIKVLAAEVGFASRSHFSRAFRGMFGADPTAYREKGVRAAQAGPQRARQTTIAA
jgi:AraC-like DNA-binding protein